MSTATITNLSPNENEAPPWVYMYFGSDISLFHNTRPAHLVRPGSDFQARQPQCPQFSSSRSYTISGGR